MSKTSKVRKLFLIPTIAFAATFCFNPLFAGGNAESQEFNITATIDHHLADAYAFEVGHSVLFSFPRILIDNGVQFFPSTEAAIEAGYVDAAHYDHSVHHGKLASPSIKEPLEALLAKSMEADADQEAIHEEIHALVGANMPLDLSITKNVAYMMLAALLMFFVFISMANAYKKRPNSVPKGMQSFFEPLVVFIRDDIAKENIPHHYRKFTPLLLTMFFFIWFLNLLGLTPFAANVTGNIAVTISLSLFTLLATNLFSTKSYWGHIFWFPGVPIFVKPIMFVVEFLGIFTKPFALTIRLFANMTAGHVVVLSLISLIFILGEVGANPTMGWVASGVSVAFVLFIDLLELFVAILQAYVFTLLTSVFIGQAVEESH